MVYDNDTSCLPATVGFIVFRWEKTTRYVPALSPSFGAQIIPTGNRSPWAPKAECRRTKPEKWLYRRIHNVNSDEQNRSMYSDKEKCPFFKYIGKKPNIAFISPVATTPHVAYFSKLGIQFRKSFAADNRVFLEVKLRTSHKRRKSNFTIQFIHTVISHTYTARNVRTQCAWAIRRYIYRNVRRFFNWRRAVILRNECWRSELKWSLP